MTIASINSPQSTADDSKATLNVYQRLLAVMDAVGGLGKSGTADGSVGGYRFHRIDDIEGALRPALVENGLAMMPRVTSHTLEAQEFVNGRGDRKVQWVANLQVEVEVTNVDDPVDSVVFSTVGHGIDSGDKAFGKALSYALKMWLLSALHLRGGEDNEADDHGDRPTPAPNLSIVDRKSALAWRPAFSGPQGQKFRINEKKVGQVWQVAESKGWTKRQVHDWCIKVLGCSLPETSFKYFVDLRQIFDLTTPADWSLAEPPQQQAPPPAGPDSEDIPGMDD
ncbi:MAG: ERF family protein [Acidobacteriota bacterium]